VPDSPSNTFPVTPAPPAPLTLTLLGPLAASLAGQPGPLPGPNSAARDLLLVLAIEPAQAAALLGPALDGAALELRQLGLAALLDQPEQIQSDLKTALATTDLRGLAPLRQQLAADHQAHTPVLANWLIEARFTANRHFYRALLDHAARLYGDGRQAEASANRDYVLRQCQQLRPDLAAQLRLDVAAYHWRLQQSQASSELIEAALPDLASEARRKAAISLAAALVRLGRCTQALAALHELPSAPADQGWAWLHRANAQRWLGQLEAAQSSSASALALAKSQGDGHLAVAALLVTGECWLVLAQQDQPQQKALAKNAVFALGQALGISEVLGEAAGAAVLAALGHAHALWGSPSKAFEVAEKGFKRARSAHDNAAAARALLALLVASQNPSYGRQALAEARLAGHRPLEQQIGQALLPLLKGKEREGLATALTTPAIE
jgi:hypothetical protein